MAYDEISAKYNSRCHECGGSIKVDERIGYDREKKKGVHLRCVPPEPVDLFADQPSPEHIALADKLGFE